MEVLPGESVLGVPTGFGESRPLLSRLLPVAGDVPDEAHAETQHPGPPAAGGSGPTSPGLSAAAALPAAGGWGSRGPFWRH